MSHQPFETWLLEPEGLSAGQRAELEQHLSGCARCRQLGSSLQSVDQILTSAGMVRPRPAFAARFAATLHWRREQRQRKQTIIILAGTLLGSLSILVVLLLLGIPQLAGMGVEILGATATAIRQVSILTQLGLSLLQTLDFSAYPLVMLWPALAIGFAITATYTVVSVTWTALYLRLATQPIQWSRRV